MNRNVRDIYIILFVLLILMGLGIYKGAIKIPKPILILSILLLGITRAVLLPLIGFVLFLKYRHQISRFKRVILDIFFISIALYFLPKILFSATRQFVSAAEFSGEKINEYLPLLHGDISFSTILPYIKRISIGFVSFLFTPHPINYINKFITTSDELGRMTIYTGLDNALIIAGSIFTYLFVVPLIFFIIDHRKDVDKLVFIFGLLFGILYALAYLGISDIRNKVAVIFFILISLYNTNLKIKLTKKYYLYTFILLLGIYLVSN